MELDLVLTWLPFIGRLLIGLFFLFFGFWNIFHWQATISVMSQRHIPLPSFVLIIGILLQMLCAIFIILGIYLKLSALALILFTLVAVHIFHCFWHMDGMARQLNFVIYITHMTSTIGGLMLLIHSTNLHQA
tara:strand:+ start:856 stop:1251 length:396 start_codon:yes stop_codon:yes gene_type:complete